MERTVAGVTIECVRGDITNQPDLQAVVNAANAELKPGGGVAGAIHKAAGPGLEKECRPFAPILPGQAVITGGHNLPNKYVIHCLGPVYGQDKPEEDILAQCYRNVLRLAEEQKVESVAFPAISTGAFGYPLAEAARVAFRTVVGLAPKLEQVKRVRFVLWGERDYDIHVKALQRTVES